MAGREARTHFRLIERLSGAQAGWSACSIRDVHTRSGFIWHISAIHWLVIRCMADARVSPCRRGAFPRQALHAFQLGLKHPASGEDLLWRVPLAADLERLIASLRVNRQG